MRAGAREEVELADLWEKELIDRGSDPRRRGQRRVIQQLVAIHDLQHAAAVRAVAEEDPVFPSAERIAIGPERNRSVKVDRDLVARQGRPGLLPYETKVADEDGVGRIAECGHLRQAT